MKKHRTGTRVVCLKLREGEAVMLYGHGDQVALQLRRLVHGRVDPLAASFKSSLVLDRDQCWRLVSELVRAIAQQ